MGYKPGKKSKSVRVPSVTYIERDLFRGIIDGDGSIGITENNIPFVSLATTSKYISIAYRNIIKKVLGKSKTSSPNKRDGEYNITLYSEDAQQFLSYLYYKDCLCLKRKLKSVQEVLKWKRPKGRKKINKNIWTEKEIKYLISHTVGQSMVKLERSYSSVKTKKWRLKQSSGSKK